MNFTKLFTYIGLGFLGLTSCQDDEMFVATAPEFIPSDVTEYVFTADNATDSVAFKWTKSQPSETLPLTYAVELSLDSAFSQVIKVGETKNDSLNIAYGDMNRELIRAGAQPDKSMMVYQRVAGYVNSNQGKLVSSVKPLKVTLYYVSAYANIAIAGSNNGWNPGGEENTLIYSPKNNNIYAGYIHFGEEAGKNEFKVCPDHAWGTDMGGADGVLGGGSNIVLDGGAGIYLMEVNLNENTYKETATVWGIIGMNGDWDNDIALVPTSNPLILTADVDVTADCDFKFRANKDWAINFGGVLEDGILVAENAPNIKVTPGNYTVTFDLSVYPYTFKLEIIK